MSEANVMVLGGRAAELPSLRSLRVTLLSGEAYSRGAAWASLADEAGVRCSASRAMVRTMNDSRSASASSHDVSASAPVIAMTLRRGGGGEAGIASLVDHPPQRRQSRSGATGSEDRGGHDGAVAVGMAERQVRRSSQESPGGTSTDCPQRTHGPLGRWFSA
jgi:hypothetical protein